MDEDISKCKNIYFAFFLHIFNHISADNVLHVYVDFRNQGLQYHFYVRKKDKRNILSNRAVSDLQKIKIFTNKQRSRVCITHLCIRDSS